MSGKENTIQALLRAGSFSAAKPLIDKEMSDNPKDPVIWRLWVEHESLQGNHKTALGLLDKALQITPNDHDLRFYEIIALYKTGEIEKCNLKIAQYEEEFPLKLVEASLFKGYLAVKQGNLKEAKEHASVIQGLRFSKHRAVELELQIARASNSMMDTLKFAQQAVEVEPTDANAYSILAFAQFDLLMFPSAFRSARKALRLDPTQRRPAAVFWLAWLLIIPPFLLCHLMYMSKRLAPLMPKFVFCILVVVSPPLILHELLVDVFPQFKEYRAFMYFVLVIEFFALWPFVRNFIVNRYDTVNGMKATVSLSGY